MSKNILKLKHQSQDRPSCSPSTFRLLTFGLLLIFNSCGLDVEDPTPPSPPVWVQKSLPEEWPEHGIDAHESGGIYLEWKPNLEEDIVAYNIYRAIRYEVNDSLGDFDLLAHQAIEATNKLEYVDRVAVPRTQYYYQISSEDVSGNMGDLSDSLSYSLMPNLNSELSPNGQTVQLDGNRMLSWVYFYTIAMEEYTITILAEDDELVLRTVVMPGNYIGRTESWQIPESVLLESGQMYQWRLDTGAQYVGGYETVGSESVWATFLYAGD